jgi:glucokinase
MAASAPDFRLLADIGGTNARFALLPPASHVPEQERSLVCADFAGPEEAAVAYLDSVGNPTISEAAIDVATAVTGDLVRLTNSPWAFSIERTRHALGLRRLLVLNDFSALALSLPHLTAAELRRVGGAQAQAGSAIALIGPGTGLGVSGLIPAESEWIAVEGEGGHVAFSPMNEREDGVLAVLRRRFGHVSAERLASGPGLVNIYEALCKLDAVAVRAVQPQQVTEAALSGTDAHCLEALDIFCSALGTTAANLVVTLGARGGLYIGGGIVPRLGPYFDRSPFRARFESKGRFSGYVAAIPAFVILADYPALRGLAVAINRVSGPR